MRIEATSIGGKSEMLDGFWRLNPSGSECHWTAASPAGYSNTINRPGSTIPPKMPATILRLPKRPGSQYGRFLQVPLNTREKTIGVLMAMNKIGGDFTEPDEELLGAMANNIALAIENATVYEKLKKSRDDLEMIYRSSMALATTMDLDHLLEVVISELRSAMDVEAAGVLLYDERQAELYLARSSG